MKKNQIVKVISLLTITLFSVAHGMERVDTVFGTPKIVQRTFTATPKECLDMLPTAAAPRQVWKCVFVYPGSTNAFSFNPALELKDKGRISATSDLIFELESHPNGGSIGFSAPNATNPGYGRMIPLDEVRKILEKWTTETWRKFEFRGTFLVM